LATTFVHQDKNVFTQIAQELHCYIIMPYLLTKKGGLKTQKSGVGLEHTLMIEHGGRSRWVGELDEDVSMIIDHLKKMKVNYCLLNDSMSYTRTELIENKGEDRINNVFTPRKQAMWLRVAETMEEVFYQTPDADDDLTPWGLKYWIVKNATTGFNGGYPTGFTRIANINLTDAPTFKNYTAQYTTPSKTDLIKKMKRAHRQTGWKSPKKMKGFEGDTSDRRIHLCNEDTLEAMEEIGEAQNENLGRDLAPYEAGKNNMRMGLKSTSDGDLIFRKCPIIWAEGLDSDTSDPIYGLDMNTFNALTYAGDNMRLGDFKVAPRQHRAYEAFLDHKHQTICTNRRNNWVISK